MSAWGIGGLAVIVAAWVPPTVCPWGQAPCDLRPAFDQVLATTVVTVGFVACALLRMWARRGETVDADPPRQSAPLPWLVVGSVVGVLAGAHLLLFAPMIAD